MKVKDIISNGLVGSEVKLHLYHSIIFVIYDIVYTDGRPDDRQLNCVFCSKDIACNIVKGGNGNKYIFDNIPRS